MATPAMTPTSVSAQVIPGSAGKIRVTTLDSAGAPLNVSSGYTMDFLNAVPSAGANSAAPAVDLSSLVSAAFDATGVDLTFTAAQATSIAQALAVLSNQVGIGLTNDSGTTKTLAAIIALTVRPDKQLQA